MENMSTAESDAGLLAKSRAETDGAEVLGVFAWSLFLWHLVDAVLMNAGWMLGLASAADARMAARMNVGARLLHEIEAIWLSAYVTERWLNTRRWLF